MMTFARCALLISLVMMVGCPPPHPTVEWTPPDATAAEADAAAPPDAMPPEPDAPPPDASPVEMFDCATIPPAPLSVTQLVAPRGYHGLAISEDGYIIGSDGSSLIRSTYDNQAALFVPNAGSGQQMDWLGDGDLVFATNDNALTRIMSNGGRSPITTDVRAYGVVVGPDEMIYVVDTSQREIVRVDPATGHKQTLVPDAFSGTPRPIEFSPDARRLYIGTIGGGTVHYVELDDDLNAVGGLHTLVTGMGGWHDAIGVDACGNLYVPDYNTRTLYRISPAGAVTSYFQAPSLQQYPHGLVWGTGEHGWRDDALYLPLPYNGNTVMEIVIGVPSRDFKGTVVNAPPMTP